MNKLPPDYKMNKKDIETVLGILKRTDPENATPEKAIEFLEYLQEGFHQIAHTNPEKLEEWYKELKRQKKYKNN